MRRCKCALLCTVCCLSALCFLLSPISNNYNLSLFIYSTPSVLVGVIHIMGYGYSYYNCCSHYNYYSYY
ncbi:hypothetical protein B484DRAFT_449519 [Ochromonadaceae sp. CCMP2298]|nr:hypothetical protein B484DRAFT_449519 [Ochromonadaceae sp. CCMP2298]